MLVDNYNRSLFFSFYYLSDITAGPREMLLARGWSAAAEFSSLTGEDFPRVTTILLLGNNFFLLVRKTLPFCAEFNSLRSNMNLVKSLTMDLSCS